MSRIEQNVHIAGLIEALVLALMAMGTVFVFSAGANVSIDYDLQHFYDFAPLKQVLFFPLAVLVLYLCSRLDYEKFGFEGSPPAKSFSPYLLMLAIVLLILVLVPGIGVQKHAHGVGWIFVPALFM